MKAVNILYSCVETMLVTNGSAASPKHFEETVGNVPVRALQLTGAGYFHMHDWD